MISQELSLVRNKIAFLSLEVWLENGVDWDADLIKILFDSFLAPDDGVEVAKQRMFLLHQSPVEADDSLPDNLDVGVNFDVDFQFF